MRCKILMRGRVVVCRDCFWCRLLVVVVGGNREGDDIFDGILGVGDIFFGLPCMWWVPGRGE